MIKAIRLNSVNLLVQDLEKSLEWYNMHLGFERMYDVEGGVLIGRDGVEIVLSPAADPDAPLADPTIHRCIHTIGFEVSQEDLEKVKTEFAEDPDIVEIDHPRFKSFITEDPDGYCIELYVEKADKKAFREILKKVPNRKPLPGDEL